ncbi:MAG: KH domain-containing protein [Clostridiales bacterium]|nr:KH domain-containing protein [Clostridiales bacterium]
MNSYESTGKSVEEAISEGLKHLGLSIGEVKVDILEEGSKGLFGLFGSKPSRVRLTVNKEEESSSVFAQSLSSYDAQQSASKARQTSVKPQSKLQSKPESKPVVPDPKPVTKTAAAETKVVPKAAVSKPKAEKTPRAEKTDDGKKGQAPKQPRVSKTSAPRKVREHVPAEPLGPAEQKDPESLEGLVQSFLQNLTKLMDVQVNVHVHTDNEGNIRVNMQGDTLGILIGRRGETLDALQYLTGLHLNRGKEQYVRVTLDSEGYRAKREDALVRLATRMANRAQRTGRRVSLEPMNPYERRILHSALQDHEGITTHSEGEEPNRHLVITPSRDAAPKQDAKKPQKE